MLKCVSRVLDGPLKWAKEEKDVARFCILRDFQFISDEKWFVIVVYSTRATVVFRVRMNQVDMLADFRKI